MYFLREYQNLYFLERNPFMKKSTGIKRAVKSIPAPSKPVKSHQSDEAEVTPSQQIDEFETQVLVIDYREERMVPKHLNRKYICLYCAYSKI